MKFECAFLALVLLALGNCSYAFHSPIGSIKRVGKVAPAAPSFSTKQVSELQRGYRHSTQLMGAKSKVVQEVPKSIFASVPPGVAAVVGAAAALVIFGVAKVLMNKGGAGGGEGSEKGSMLATNLTEEQAKERSTRLLKEFKAAEAKAEELEKKLGEAAPEVEAAWDAADELYAQLIGTVITGEVDKTCSVKETDLCKELFEQMGDLKELRSEVAAEAMSTLSRQHAELMAENVKLKTRRNVLLGKKVDVASIQQLIGYSAQAAPTAPKAATNFTPKAPAKFVPNPNQKFTD
ncbi:unnamed protein product [Heterosigma akashiwo]|uniref:Uncharacterized protein n=1 Tax=Heterosigma akashiwo TaxID=2829 RepID=A0A7S3XWX7_HETAK|eukprot:CAMPEP_0194562778 /NCGR_PEP_ID=MMETSP0292-20121207/3091_1 /TAXON_ID=39354 /ORGANISM="Heterosigma akashiwo, Strain CCMP2393" /LENGTH=291 /DNA_ID=CAMNT_0039411563 /DNA_START=29 /DNA_END=904 /DNA_ORIENTATION=-